MSTSANRLLLHLGQCCPKCTARQRLRERLLSIEETCVQIEADTNKAIEFVVPCAKSWRDGKRSITFFIMLEPERIRLSDDIRQATAAQLREIGNKLCAAATSIETNGGAA